MAYFDNLFMHATEQNRNNVWKVINKTLKRQNNTEGVSELQVQNKRLTGAALADYFNAHFVNLVPPL